jgi:hypothetical protein
VQDCGGKKLDVDIFGWELDHLHNVINEKRRNIYK